jgi:hypothetical protein
VRPGGLSQEQLAVAEAAAAVASATRSPFTAEVGSYVVAAMLQQQHLTCM